MGRGCNSVVECLPSVFNLQFTERERKREKGRVEIEERKGKRDRKKERGGGRRLTPARHLLTSTSARWGKHGHTKHIDIIEKKNTA